MNNFTHSPLFVLIQKEFLAEWRSKVALFSLFLFVLVSVALVNFTVGFFTLTPPILFGLIWLTIFFAGMYGFNRAFVAEFDQMTSEFLRFLAKPLHIYLSKLYFNLVLSLGLSFSVLLIFLFFFSFPSVDWVAMMMGIFFGSIALSAASTFLAALVAQADSKGALFPLLAFPLLIPLMMVLSNYSKLVINREPWELLMEPIGFLLSFIGVTVTAGILLFDYIWE